MDENQRVGEELRNQLRQLQQRVAELEVAEHQHQRTATLLDRLFELSVDLCCVAGFDGYYKRVNPAFQRVLGYSEEESLSKPFMEFIHPDDRPAASDEMKRLATGGSVARFVDRNICKDGSCRWLEWTVTPMPEDGLVYGIGRDVTERHQIAAQLEANRALLLATIESLPFDFFALDRGGRYFLQNSTSRKRSGDVTGHSLEELNVDPESKALWLECNRKAQSGQLVEEELELTFAGQRRTYQNIVNPIRLHGEIAGIAGIAIDVTQQKRARQELQQARDELEQRVVERTAELEATNRELQAMYEGMVDGVLIVDRDTLEILRTNTSMCRLLGYREDELLEMSLERIQPDASAPGIVSAIRRCWEEGADCVSDVPCLCCDGTSRFGDVSASQFVYQGRECLAVFFHDSTARRQAQEALQESERRLRALVEQAADVIGVFDRTGRFRSINQRGCKLMGYTEEEFTQLDVFMLSPKMPRERIEQLIQSVCDSDEPITLETLAQRKDGTFLPLEIRVGRLQVSNEILLLGIARDISERKQLEREVLTATTREQRRIGQEIHDGIGQQLTGLSFLAHSLERSTQWRSEHEAKTAGDIARGLQEAARVVHGIVRGVLPLNLSNVDLPAALQALGQQIEERFHRECKYRGVQSVSLDEETMTQLYFIAQEAATNAAKHARPQQIEIQLEATNDRVVLTVLDDGSGIPDTESRRPGAGLQIMEYRADLIGGQLRIERMAAGGSQVRCEVRHQQAADIATS
jgi:PAS domain S-box-containing protein